MDKNIDYNRIIRECFRDMDISADDITAMAEGDDRRQQSFLCEKILLNSTKLLRDLTIFHTDHLSELLKGLKVPSFNAEYFYRRKNIAQVWFFDSPLEIDELKWLN